MDEFIKLLNPVLDYVSHELLDDTIIIKVISSNTSLCYPYCGYNSSKRHNSYELSFRDLPVMGKKSKIIIQNRKMFCLNTECQHITFAETYAFIKPKAKKSNRLLEKIIDVSLSTSSVNPADILRDGIADVGKSTICNL